MKRIQKYSNPKRVVKEGYRRATKSELKDLGYSPRSVLYTKKDVKNPTKFLTRADVSTVLKPLREKQIYSKFGFSEIKRERIRAARRKIFRHTFAVYSDYKNPLTLTQAIDKTNEFLDFLKVKFNPTERNQLGIIYKGDGDDFSIQPRLWRDRKSLIIETLETMLKKYKAKIKIIFIIGWLEQSK